MTSRFGRVLFFICHSITLIVFAGCGPQIIRPAVEWTCQSTTHRVDWSDLGLLCYKIVLGDDIDPAKLLDNRRLLDRVMAMLGKCGPDSTPELFPNQNSRLAYLLNAHNAAMLRSLIALAKDHTLSARLSNDVDYRFRFPIDGKLQTPADLRREVLTLAADDWRVRLALYSGRRIGPPLSRRVFLPEMLEDQIEIITRSALTSPHIIQIDHGYRRRLLIWRGLYDIRSEMIRDYERRVHTSGATLLNVLLEWSERFRRETLNSAVGYTVTPLPEDQRVNAKVAPTAQ